jgi:hypothetical protein
MKGSHAMTDVGTTGHLGRAGHLRGYRRFLGTGIGSGLLGAICCVGSAIAVGAGVGGLSFFTTWMRHYQIYFIIASITIMAAWLLRLVRASGADRGLAAAARGIWRQALTMAAVYTLTLLAASAAAGLIR